ncbi:MAG: T9SS type A sorting domain-containing protein [Bacteroidia bacterium]
MKHLHYVYLGLCLLLTFPCVSQNATLNFEYDAAGNQVKYYYCLDGSCYKKQQGSYARVTDTPNDESFAVDEEQSKEDIPQSDFKIYPNPTSGLVNLHLHNLVFETIEIFDINAKRILQINTKNKEFIEIDLSAYPTGTYLLRALQTDGQIITKKIIKK